MESLEKIRCDTSVGNALRGSLGIEPDDMDDRAAWYGRRAAPRGPGDEGREVGREGARDAGRVPGAETCNACTMSKQRVWTASTLTTPTISSSLSGSARCVCNRSVRLRLLNV